MHSHGDKILSRFGLSVVKTDQCIMVMPRQIPRQIMDYSSDESPSYHTEYLYSITGKLQDIEQFIDFAVKYDPSVSPNIESGNIDNYVHWVRDKMDDEREEEKIRHENPIAQAAWEQYQATIILVK
jgi:DNA replicative helicase MCM subunit Mcm2 (Cdc46/Mcm family)